MKPLFLISSLLASIFFSSAQAGKFYTLDSKWSWDYDHFARTARLQPTSKEYKIDCTSTNIEAFARWDEGASQLTVVLHGKEGELTAKKMEPLVCTVDSSQACRRFEIMKKEPDQGDFRRFIELPATDEGECLNHEGQYYRKLLDDYFEKKEQKEDILQEAMFCTAVEVIDERCNRKRHKHTIEDGQLIEKYEVVSRQSTQSADPREKRKITIGKEIRSVGNPRDFIVDTPGNGGKCPAHPDSRGLGAGGSNTGCPRKSL